ncbi:proteasome subunit beta type [Gregarina niphandrodes]|uniref:Proteasome subunit beta n=1 Tax=Gregarina niphandrodes TaxID=110365 RepID=A0A023BB46_GRENI|nr:proteasome subunit beta type [Gregarina niphandrodes]EZG78638.1 proteasome subunit beta type [Gregarina niphandrodes]|eukprot:XP_011129229.1 proteasome subunit beta type [Gregarina niphandrodes]
MGIDDYNGGAALAMLGDGCICVASDKRIGSNSLKTVEMNYEKCFEITPHTYLACCGLATDVETLYKTIRFHKNLFHLREEREMKPRAVASFVGNQLYQRRFSPWFASPIVAGVDAETGEPYAESFDFIGGLENIEDFGVVGTATEQIMGACEAHWRPNLKPEELAECAATCLLAGVERDCYSGWGAVVHVVTKDRVITRHIESRMD